MTQPNIVFIIADQHRWDMAGWGANGVTDTPHLDALARRGVLFRSAYCTAPLCCPSRAALASGRYGMNTGCFTNLHELPPGTPGFVGQLRGAGYRTSAVGKTHMEIHAYTSDLTSPRHKEYMDSLGWDEVEEISGNSMLRAGIRCAYSEFLLEAGRLDDVIAHYEQWSYFLETGRPADPNFKPHPWTLPEEYEATHWIADRAINWLEGYAGERPFFLHVGFTHPHSPIQPLPRLMARYADREETAPWNWADPPEWLADGRRGYRAMITLVDEQVGRIVSCLARRGLLENTILVYVADHGEMAGDQGRFDKVCFHEGSVRVPLVIAGPGVAVGRETSAIVEVIDLGKTLCGLAGVAPHDRDQGRSLAPLLRGETDTHRDTAYAEMGCDRMLFDGRYKLMWGDPKADGRELGRLHLDRPVNVPPAPPRLYDLAEDPHETRDLAGDPAHAPLLTEMLARLIERINANTETQPYLDRGPYRPLVSSRRRAEG
jgi:arylsulfatase